MTLLRVSTVLALFLVACKPATEEERFKRDLAGFQVDKVKAHLEAGNDANHEFPDGSRPLHVVAKSSTAKSETARLLIDKGADVNAKNKDGKTAWDLRWGDPRRGLSEDDTSVLLALIDGGFEPPKEGSEEGRTLLHEVGRRAPSARLASILVKEHGFEVDARDDNGWTPLHFAAFENNAQAATGLLEAGADPNAETTKTIEKAYDRAGTKAVRYRYAKGSRPLNLFRYSKKGRFDEDVRKVLEQHGATENPDVENRMR